MKGFYQQRHNVLLCTTIIETGIDIPTANTIVIHRADPLRPGAAAPAARPRRTLAPPGLRLSADAGRGCHHEQRQEAPGGHPGHGRARFGLLPGHARPGNPRHRRNPG
uniref:helicase-related protein n=1 Tax=Bordetella pertussis TaxID=520 RepID=UPI0035AB8305